MSKPIVDDNFSLWPERKDTLEDTFVHATEKQINYIEILRHDLGMSLPARNAHIMTAIGKSFKGDVWALSKAEASRVINKFKEWKEQAK